MFAFSMMRRTTTSWNQSPISWILLDILYSFFMEYLGENVKVKYLIYPVSNTEGCWQVWQLCLGYVVQGRGCLHLPIWVDWFSQKSMRTGSAIHSQWKNQFQRQNKTQNECNQEPWERDRYIDVPVSIDRWICIELNTIKGEMLVQSIQGGGGLCYSSVGRSFCNKGKLELAVLLYGVPGWELWAISSWVQQRWTTVSEHWTCMHS